MATQRRQLHLTPATAAGLAELARRAGASIEQVLSAGFAALTARERGHDPPGGGDPPALELIVRAAAAAAKASAHEVRFLVEERVLEAEEAAFDPEALDRTAAHFAVLLEGLVADATLPVSRLPLLTDPERRQLLVEWNATGADFPADRCLHELFAAHARAAPDAPALIFDRGAAGVERLTYGELAARAGELAARLRALGVGRGALVGLCVARSPAAAIGILAVLEAGGAYVPLDPDYPEERLRFMIADTRLGVLLTDRDQTAVSTGFTGTVLRVDEAHAPTATGSAADAATASAAVSGAAARRDGARPEDLAYVIYTSGSTGTPKGIALSHRGVVNNVTDLNRRFAVAAGDRVLAISSLSFDMSVYELLGTLAAGAAIVLPADTSPPALVEVIVRERVTVWSSAPALLEALVQYARALMAAHFPSLRLALLGGDWIPVELPERLKALAPEVRVIALGGATEASIHSTIFAVERRDPAWRRIPYGRPMANQRVYVLDAALAPVPIGAPGELYLGGVGLARGYLHRPELTAERFIPSPFDSGQRIYKTGDLVKWRPDGNLDLIGRIDQQIKLRGLRIEAGEIEARLRTHPAVRESVVVLREDAPGDPRLVAYYVTGGCAAPDPDALRAHLARGLPPAMIPSAFMALAELPLSPNGKIDRRALAAPRPRAGYLAPRNPVEEVLAAVWADVLGAERLGVRDNFFELGGHSLLAARILARTRDYFQIDVGLRALYAAPTVAGLAERLLADARERPRVERTAQLLVGMSEPR